MIALFWLLLALSVSPFNSRMGIACSWSRYRSPHAFLATDNIPDIPKKLLDKEMDDSSRAVSIYSDVPFGQFVSGQFALRITFQFICKDRRIYRVPKDRLDRRKVFEEFFARKSSQLPEIVGGKIDLRH